MLEDKKIVFEEIDKILRDIDEKRDEAIKICKELIKKSTYAIISIHSEKFNEAQKYIEEAKKIKEQLDKLIESNPRVQEFLSDMIKVAYQEFVEANQFFKILKEKDIYRPEELEVDFLPYLLGTFDAIGETKRKIYDLMLKGDEKEVLSLIKVIERLYEFTAPLSLYKFVNEVRRNVDITRKTLEELKRILIMSKICEKLDLSDFSE